MRDWAFNYNKKWTWYMVFQSKEKMEKYEKNMKILSTETNIKKYEELKKSGVVVIEPSYKEKFNVEMSPTIVALYNKGDNGKKDYIWSKIGTGNMSNDIIINDINQFLVYNKIIDPKTLATGNSIKNFHKNTKNLSQPVKTDNSKIHKSNQKLEVK